MFHSKLLRNCPEGSPIGSNWFLITLLIISHHSVAYPSYNWHNNWGPHKRYITGYVSRMCVAMFVMGYLATLLL